MELATLIAPGNTQPGSFYSNNKFGSTLSGNGQLTSRQRNEHAPAAPSSTDWRLTDEMMHQPWGSVLRQLDPNQNNMLNRLPTPTPGRRSAPMVPSVGAGKAYTHSLTGARLAPPPGVPPQYSASALGGSQLRPDLLSVRPYAS